MKKLFILFLLCGSCFGTTTVTGNVKNLGTGTIGTTSFVRFWLRGCGGNQPRVNGTAIIAPSQGKVFYFDIAANSSGAVSGTIYSTRDSAGTGDGEIECGGSKTAAYYGMQIYDGGKPGIEMPVMAKSGQSINVSNITPLSTQPVVIAPTGDSTYCRLDGGNGQCGTTTTSQEPYDIRISGAKVDGITDDTGSITTAIAAADAANAYILVPNTGHLAVISPNTLALARKTKVVCESGAGFTMNSLTGYAFLLGNTVDTSWFNIGGIKGCRIENTAGGTSVTNTSVGIQVGSGVNNGQNIAVEHNTITGFGTGIEFVGNGLAFNDLYFNNTIYQNKCNGLYFNYNAGVSAEHLYFVSNKLFQNGTTGVGGSGTCTNINVAAGSFAEFFSDGDDINNGGSAGIGEVYVPATSALRAHFHQLHSENSGADSDGGPRPFLNCLAISGNECRVDIDGSTIGNNSTTATNLPLFQIRSGIITIVGGELFMGEVSQTGTTPMVLLGDGTHNELLTYNSYGVRYAAYGSAAGNAHLMLVKRNTSASPVVHISGSQLQTPSLGTAQDLGTNNASNGYSDLMDQTLGPALVNGACSGAIDNTGASRTFDCLDGNNDRRVRAPGGILFEIGTTPAEGFRIDGTGKMILGERGNVVIANEVDAPIGIVKDLTVGFSTSGGAVNTSIGNNAGLIVFHTALTSSITVGSTVTLAGTCTFAKAYVGAYNVVSVVNGADTTYAIADVSSGACGADAPGSWSITSASASHLKFAALPPIYANNAAALAGGLVAGQVYRTGGDPDALAVVH